MNNHTTPRCVPIPLASGKTGYIFAGPTRTRLEGYALVRLAAEIEVPIGIVAYNLPVSDFKPLDPLALMDAIPNILNDLESGVRLYVGCMGGSGRTGTLLALLVAQHPSFDGTAAISYIRQVYKASAIETKEQEWQVHTLAGKMPQTFAPSFPPVEEFTDAPPNGFSAWIGATTSNLWGKVTRR